MKFRRLSLFFCFLFVGICSVSYSEIIIGTYHCEIIHKPNDAGIQRSKNHLERITAGDSAKIQLGIANLDLLLARGYSTNTVVQFVAEVNQSKSITQYKIDFYNPILSTFENNFNASNIPFHVNEFTEKTYDGNKGLESLTMIEGSTQTVYTEPRTHMHELWIPIWNGFIQAKNENRLQKSNGNAQNDKNIYNYELLDNRVIISDTYGNYQEISIDPKNGLPIELKQVMVDGTEVNTSIIYDDVKAVNNNPSSSYFEIQIKDDAIIIEPDPEPVVE